jgi:hypothetical protein
LIDGLATGALRPVGEATRLVSEAVKRIFDSISIHRKPPLDYADSGICW